MTRWFSEGEKTNPADESVLADTGVLRSGPTAFDVIVSATAAAGVRIEHRDAANAVTLDDQLVFVAANVAEQVRFGPFNVAADERIRVAMEAALTGRIQASIITLP